MTNRYENPRSRRQEALSQERIKKRIGEIGEGNYGRNEDGKGYWKKLERSLSPEAKDRFYRCSVLAAEIMYVRPENMNPEEEKARRGEKVTELLGRMSELTGTKRYLSITAVAEAAAAGDKGARTLIRYLDYAFNRAADQMVENGERRPWEHFVEKAIAGKVSQGEAVRGSQERQVGRAGGVQRQEEMDAAERERRRLSEIDKATWLRHLLVKGGQLEPGPPHLWKIDAPFWFKNGRDEIRRNEEWGRFLSLINGIDAKIISRRSDNNLKVGPVEYKNAIGQSTPMISAETMVTLNEKLPGFDGVMKKWMDKLLVVGERGMLELRPRREIEDFISNPVAVKEMVVGEVMREGGRSEEEATIMTAVAFDVLEGLGVFDLADIRRELDFLPVVGRTVTRPGVDYKAKLLKGASFGGTVGDWMNNYAKGDPKKIEELERRGLLPSVLCGSGLDYVKVRLGDGSEISWRQALAESKKIDWRNTRPKAGETSTSRVVDSSNLLKGYLDAVGAAADVLQYWGGKEPFVLEANKDIQAQVTKWSKDLVSAVGTIDEGGVVGKVSAGTIAMAIAGPIGLWERSGNPLLKIVLPTRIGTGEAYGETGVGIVGNVGIKDSEGQIDWPRLKEVSRLLNITGKGAGSAVRQGGVRQYLEDNRQANQRSKNLR